MKIKKIVSRSPEQKKDPMNPINRIYEKARKRAEESVKNVPGNAHLQDIEHLNSDTEYSQLVQYISEGESGSKQIYNTLIASLVMKVMNPRQNIEYYSDDSRRGWKRGYNIVKFAREFIAPFLIEKGFQSAPASIKSRMIPEVLTRWPRKAWNEEFPGRKDIKNKHVRRAFFEIIADVQEKGASPEKYLEDLFTLSICRRLEREKDIPKVKKNISMSTRKAMSIIDRHVYFDYSRKGRNTYKNTSKLPVLAVWSYYKCAADHSGGEIQLDMYNSHFANDSADSPGDIVARDSAGTVRECVDTKGCSAGARLTGHDIESAYKRKILPAFRAARSEGCECLTRGYYFVYTEAPTMEEQINIRNFADKAYAESGVDIQAISMDEFLKNRLPYIESKAEFLENHFKEVRLDRHGELLDSHRNVLKAIYKDENLLYDDNKRLVNQRDDRSLSADSDAFEIEI